ncbi:CBO0543 family protein [Bacillus sp. 31A1R]|uniref:CBO0543 family protein n=1 Tax=Robertmurraya mangrovi TaxID=3098077 RepID=A0ABU5IWL3_9BACI|nr:CBO0543 family protein [Bacillus sp. 31A1R]MDZ5471542.1 CBO0543 family protein [Bacillus sp. 31A1R]
MGFLTVIELITNHIHYVANISYHEVIEAEENFYHLLKSYWKEHVFLTARWWFLLGLAGIPAAIWWKLVDKKIVIEITAYGLFYGVAAIILDSIGTSLLLWTYPVIISPNLFPQIYPYDVGVIIVPFMLIYQKWGKTIKSFWKASGILSLSIAYIAEPFMIWIDVYKPFTWKHIYSFPIYWLLAILCWYILNYFKYLEQNR